MKRPTLDVGYGRAAEEKAFDPIACWPWSSLEPAHRGRGTHGNPLPPYRCAETEGFESHHPPSSPLHSSYVLKNARIGAQCPRLREAIWGDTQMQDRSSLPFRSSRPRWQAGRCDPGCSEMPCGRGVGNTWSAGLEVREFGLDYY